jgi:hypothetical protein
MNRHSNPHCRAKTTTARATFALACTILTLTTTATVLTEATPAFAGNWMETSCENPNQSAAPSQGWTSFLKAGSYYGSDAGTSCSPGAPMVALLSSDAAVPVGAGEVLQYTPPSGSTLVGGSVDVSVSSDGYGADASAVVAAYSPAYEYNGNVFFQCAHGEELCPNSTYDWSGTLTLPSNDGGDLYLGAECGGAGGQACDEGGNDSAWALVDVWWANLLLSNSTTPTASNISGTLLTPGARGTQELAFTASDPGGPGVYTVSAQVDGKTLYSATPDTNNGACVPVGTSGGALMFDYNQPCKTSESVDLPINTTTLADGQHTLKVTVEDAAQNSSVVYDSAITTKNAPANTTVPAILAPSQVFVGAALTTKPGAWSAPTGAGSIAYGYQWEDCDTNGNNCASIAGAQSASYTPAPSDVGHTLRVLVNATDNDGLTTTSSAATSAVLSAQGSLGAPNGPGTNGTTTTNSSPTATVSPVTAATTGTGTANGTPASETAQLHLGRPRLGRWKVNHCSYVHGSVTCPYTHSALQLTGRLLNGQDQPIGNASLDIVQQIAGNNSPRIIGHTTTQANGTFTAHIPAGASRLIEVAYRAFSGDANYAAQAKIEENVQAAIQLSIITPQDTSPEGTILLTGKVQGPIPSQGVIVDLLVHYRGHWEPFRTPQTDAAGEFKAVYQFQGAIGRFPFRAKTPAGQAGFPFLVGYSKEVDVTTG